MRLLALLSGALLALGCAQSDLADPQAGAERPPIPPEDLVDESGKGDGSVFNRHNLLDDATFEDPSYLGADQIQGLFAATPYGGRRSFLADAVGADGRPVSTHIAELAAEFRINPLVLIVKLQVEASLVAQSEAPSKFLLDRAMGCGCHDGDASCSNGQHGLVPQIRCAARELRRYLDDLDSEGQTVSGWKVGVARNTADPVAVTPANRATAALYTYTPWVLVGSGGNWLFWNVYHRYARQVVAQVPNHRWIGGACSGDAGCSVYEGLCLEGAGSQAFCTRPCDRYCPDSTAPFTSVTFCADLGSSLSGIPGGFCLSRCDSDLFAGNGGCASGFTCTRAERYGEPGVFKDVCWPTP